MKEVSRNKAHEQAMIWLYSMAADPDSFQAINAENCIALIEQQRKALVSLGAHFNNIRKQRDRAWKVIDEARRKSFDDDRGERHSDAG